MALVNYYKDSIPYTFCNHFLNLIEEKVRGWRTAKKINKICHHRKSNLAGLCEEPTHGKLNREVTYTFQVLKLVMLRGAS